MDKSTFQTLYKENYESVFNHLYFLCNNYELSRDLTQDTFFKLWEQRHKIKDSKSLLPFLVKIARNLLNDSYRHGKVKQKYIDHQMKKDSHNDNVESLTDKSIIEEKLREVVNNDLSEKTRIIFVSSRFDGKSNDEIAEAFQITKKTVENQLYKATSIIREKMKDFL